ncbi:MAG: hypothetical protein LBR10_06990 [Prevotellaceae bacterium]|jgi:hypothetical protein|nr:hypothetical protein [Prevotellaceae bacterium]
MKYRNITYEKLVEHLGNVSPVLDHPEELTQNVTAEITRIAAGRKKKRKIIRIAGWLSGAAACLTLCLPAYETAQSSAYRHADMKTSESVSSARATVGIREIKRTYDVGNPESVKTAIISAVRKKSEQRNRKERIYSVCLSKIPGYSQQKFIK